MWTKLIALTLNCKRCLTDEEADVDDGEQQDERAAGGDGQGDVGRHPLLAGLHRVRICNTRAELSEIRVTDAITVPRYM